TLGLPTMKNEDWHYTNITPVADREFVLAPAPSGEVRPSDLEAFRFGTTDWHTMVFVNGRFDRALSDFANPPAGVTLRDLAAGTDPSVVGRVGTIARDDDAAMTALNAAFMYDGAVVEIAKNVEVERPIHLVFLVDRSSRNAMVHPRNLIVLGRHAKATVIESY